NWRVQLIQELLCNNSGYLRSNAAGLIILVHNKYFSGFAYSLHDRILVKRLERTQIQYMSFNALFCQLSSSLLDKHQRQAVTNNRYIVALAQQIRFADRNRIIRFRHLSFDKLVAFFIFKIKHRIWISYRSLQEPFCIIWRIRSDYF